jgi:hypothetical protein
MWQDTLVCLLWSAALVAAGYYIGRAEERRTAKSREQAIKTQAYQDGGRQVFNQMLGFSKADRRLDLAKWREEKMTAEEWSRLYMQTFDDTHTQEGS